MPSRKHTQKTRIEQNVDTGYAANVNPLDSLIPPRIGDTDVLSQVIWDPSIGSGSSVPVGVPGEILVTSGGHSEVHHEREVIKHGAVRQQQTTQEVITIPVTRYESGQMESVREGTTFTQERPLIIPAPQIAQEIIPPPVQMHLGSGARAAVTASSNFDLTEAQIQMLGPEEYERYRKKVEKLARVHEFETAEKAAAYRAEVERDAELIRRTLEHQHLRDIEFRKDLVESSIERQQQEIQLEAEYAMRVLEQEREAARKALESAKARSDIAVTIDSAVGTTQSVGHVSTHSEKMATSFNEANVRPA